MNEEGKNIQLIQDMFAAFDRGDLKTLMNNVADAVEWRSPVTNAVTGPITWSKPRRSKREVEAFFRDYLEKIKPLVFKPLRFTAKDDRVIVEGTEHSTVISSGGEYLINWVMLITVKNGKVTEFLNYYDTADIVRAMEAQVHRAA
jgi:hypothetical protein